MRYDNPKQAAETYIKGIQALYPYYEKVARIVWRWNGKVYNKNFNAEVMEETDKKIYVSYGQYGGDSIDCHGCINGRYSDEMRLFFIHKNNLPDGKRIDAPAIIAEMKKNLTEYYNKVADIRQALQTIENDKKEIDALREKARKMAEALPDRIREYYDISVYKY